MKEFFRKRAKVLAQVQAQIAQLEHDFNRLTQKVIEEDFVEELASLHDSAYSVAEFIQGEAEDWDWCDDDDGDSYGPFNQPTGDEYD